MRKILFQLLIICSTSSFCQTFIIKEDNLIVNRDTSDFFDNCGDTFSIDVNSDSKIDFTIKYKCPVEECCWRGACSTAQCYYITISTYNNFETFNYGVVPQLPASYNYTDTIDKYNGSWYNGGWLMSDFNGDAGCRMVEVGNWWGNPGYVIFRHPNNNNPLYGWIEIQVTTSSNWGFQIFGYAIEDKEINNIVDTYLNNINIQYTDSYISISNIKEKINISLIDLNGKLIDKQILTFDTQLDIDYLPSGLYILQISDDNSYVTKKILK